MSKINKTLLRRVRNHILAEPRRYNQRKAAERVSKRTSSCCTRACIGGWADMLEGDDVRKPGDVDLDRAAEKLGFNDRQAVTVFYGDWPKEFEAAWKDSTPRDVAARLAADYINRIIRTGEVT
ncbi:MAG TPA: hypothetical protein VK421_06330 [Pyrinomonadaceae bacterium]|nr:hypothetical protein [Pyrinomonadaceae bacterium]